MPHFINHKHPDINIDVSFLSQYVNTNDLVACYPGSVFEGIVKIKTNTEIPVHHIKIVFKATERVNYDAMGWKKLKADDTRLFAVRNILWGLPAHTMNIPHHVYPILEAGDHVFPFICQLPMINYPPTFHHHLIATAFSLVVTVVTDNGPISKSVPVCFQPTIETMLLKPIYTEEHKLSHHISSIVTVPTLAYNINELNKHIPCTVRFFSDRQETIHISHLCIYIKRYYTIKYKASSRTEDTVVAYYDHTKLPTTCPNNISLKLDIPDSSDLFPPMLDYSPHLKIHYKLVVTVKIRHGPINIKKKLFNMPITFGTLPVNTRASRQLESYSDIQENRASILCKPMFLKPVPIEAVEEYLPAYDEVGMPPAYRITSRCSLRSVPAV